MPIQLDREDQPATTPARPAPRRHGSTLVGLLLIALGAGILGWAGWQWWGTDWVSHRHQVRVVTQLEERWRDVEQLARTEYGVSRAVVRIPAFGPDYEMPVLDGVSEEALAAGFGHFAGTAGPGAAGNYALAAHRVTHGEPLKDMPRLEVGDEIIVETRDATYTYVLTSGGDDLTVPFTQTWMLAQRPVNPAADGVTPLLGTDPHLVTLTTCAELFHTEQRSIAFGTLVEVEPRS